jgi:hypothetical protein
MATKKASGGGNVLTKKAGPLPRWGWIAVGGGTYLAYRFLKARSAAASSTAASGTTGGTTIPAGDIEAATSAASGSQGTFSSVAAWTQAALDFGTGNGLSGADAFNQIQAYLNGNCVSQAGYNFLSSVFASSSVGLPPAAFNSAELPTLSVCPSAQQTPTPTNPAPVAAGAGVISSTLAEINASAWPQIVKYGTDANAATDFTQIGEVNGGKYSGYNVIDGAPVYAGVLGGYAQGTDFATLPDGTKIYAPTTLIQQGYEGSHT